MGGRKELVWVGSTRSDLRRFPADVQRTMGFALHVAQAGEKHPDAKPLRGFGGAGVLEVVESYDGSAYRIVYTVRVGARIYALHAFQKKSKKGIATPATEIALVKQRLQEAEAIHAAWVASGGS